LEHRSLNALGGARTGVRVAALLYSRHLLRPLPGGVDFMSESAGAHLGRWCLELSGSGIIVWFIPEMVTPLGEKTGEDV